MLVSAGAFTLGNGIVRGLSDDLHPFEIAFLRNVFGLVLLAPIIMRGNWAHLRPRNVKLIGIRGVLNAIAMMGFFTALSLAPLAEVTALSFSGPLFATVIAVVVLSERIRTRRVVAIAIGFAGALVILRPGFQQVTLGPILALGATVLWAACMVIIKILTRTDSSLTQTIYAGLMLAPITGIAAIFVWKTPTLTQTGWLFLIAALATVGQLSLVQSFKEADMTAVLPLDFTKLLWAVAIGWLAFAEEPDFWVILGGTIIFAAATYISIRESRPAPVTTA